MAGNTLHVDRHDCCYRNTCKKGSDMSTDTMLRLSFLVVPRVTGEGYEATTLNVVAHGRSAAEATGNLLSLVIRQCGPVIVESVLFESGKDNG